MIGSPTKHHGPPWQKFSGINMIDRCDKLTANAPDYKHTHTMLNVGYTNPDRQMNGRTDTTKCIISLLRRR